VTHPQHLLRHTFKLEQFRPGQEAVIQALLHGHSALAIFPTGGGKSLCYQLPALLLDGLTLVVSPLIALMKDQVDQLARLGIGAARLDSSISTEEAANIYRSLDNGTLKLLYVAPERLANERFQQRLVQLNISLLAVDEAHCVSEWGHNFRPDYLKLAQLSRSLKIPRVLALTATATPQVAAQICDSFAIDPAHHVQTGFYRPNLAIHVTPVAAEQRLGLLAERLRTQPGEAAIVYVTLQKTAEQVTQYLQLADISAAAYHAGLDANIRHRIQENFMSGDTPVVVATIAFGMGIDKANIRGVYHYNLSKSLENYMQEIGRAGRDGLPAHCELLACKDDLTVLENFTYGDTPDPRSLQECIEWLLEQGETFDLSVYELAQTFDMRPLVLNTLLTYLELEGVLQATAPFYTDYKIVFIHSQAEILQQFDPARAEFLRQLLTTGKAGRTWLTLKPQEAAAALGEDKARIIKALNYLEQKGWIRLQVAGVRQGYRRLEVPETIDALAARMDGFFQEREARDIQRLNTICQWAENPACLQQTLVAYFGETLEQPCGQCSHCQGHDHQLPSRQSPAVDEAAVHTLSQELTHELSHPRQLARFLCGISSPRLSRSRLTRHPAFGTEIETPFAQVLALCQRLLPSASEN